MTILLVCGDEQRLNERREALQQAGFSSISARSVEDGWTKVDFFDVAAIVIDHELGNDIAASAFRQRYIVWTLEAEATPEAMVADVAQLLRGWSELVQ